MVPETLRKPSQAVVLSSPAAVGCHSPAWISRYQSLREKCFSGWETPQDRQLAKSGVFFIEKARGSRLSLCGENMPEVIGLCFAIQLKR